MKFIFFCLLFLVGCNTSKPGFSPISGVVKSAPQVPVEVVVSGLGSSPLSLNLNGESSLLIKSDGTYNFSKKIIKNSEFKVTISFDPTDRNCQVIHPNGAATLSSETVKVLCTDSSSNYFSGFIQGHTGLLQLQKGSELISVTTSMNQYFFETPGSTSELITMIDPPGQDCFFSRNHLSSISSLPSSDLNIYCVNEMLGAYSIILNVSGLIGTLKVKHVNSTKSPEEISFTGAGGYIANSQALSNQRQIFEITDAPDDQRCYFNATKRHLHSMNLPTPQDTTVHVTCVPRGDCEYGGLEFYSNNGLIKDILCLNDRLYLGGTFTSIGRQLGLQSLRMGADGSGLSFNEIDFFDRIHGRVKSIVPDGKGGYFVGGDFSKVGDKKIRGLVRIDKNFLIDESFNWQPDGMVYRIILEGNELFVLGNFSKLSSGSKSYARKDFAKLVLGSGTPKLSQLQLPSGYATKVSSSAVIDSKIYMYGRFNFNSVTKILSFQMNRYTGAVNMVEADTEDNLNSLFWKEPLTGQVWLINHGYGIVNPTTLLPHPQDTTNISVPLDHFYTIDHANRLHSSDGVSLKVTNLNDLYSGAQGPSPTPYPVSVENASYGFSVGENICFIPENEVLDIEITSTPIYRSGLACFDSDLNLLNANPGQRLLISDLVAIPDGSEYLLVTGSPFFAATSVRGLVSWEVHDPYAILTPGNITSGKVLSLATDGAYIYYGGAFTTANGNSNLQRSTVFGPDAGWTFASPITHAVDAIAVSSNNLFVSSQIPGKSFFGLDLSLNDTSQIQVSPSILSPPEKLLSVSGTVATLESGVLNFRELSTLASGAAPLNSIVNQVNITSDLNRYMTLAGPDRIEFRDSIGGIDYDLQVSSFNSSSTEILVNSNSTCLYTASAELRCYDSGSGFEILTNSYDSRNYYFKKGAGNFYFFTEFFAAPEILVP